LPPTERIDRGGYLGGVGVRAGGSWRAGRDLAPADGDQAARIVAEFPLAAAGLISARVVPPLPIDL
jgi:hypothetical protein